VSAATWIVLVILVLAVVIAAGVLLSRNRASASLRRRFGPEYDRAVEEHGDRRAAERKLADIAHRRDSLDVRPLPAERRRELSERWEVVQGTFVDGPREATGQADALVTEVMRDRGYPVDDHETRAGLVAADHPDIVVHYRAAHATLQRDGRVDTEDLRHAFQQYRELFGRLLMDGAEAADHAAVSRRARAALTRPDTTADRATAVERGTTADRATAVERGTTADRATAVERGTTADRGTATEPDAVAATDRDAVAERDAATVYPDADRVRARHDRPADVERVRPNGAARRTPPAEPVEPVRRDTGRR